MVTDGFFWEGAGVQGKVAKVILGLSQGLVFALKLFICLLVCLVFFSRQLSLPEGKLFGRGTSAVVHTKLYL